MEKLPSSPGSPLDAPEDCCVAASNGAPEAIPAPPLRSELKPTRSGARFEVLPGAPDCQPGEDPVSSGSVVPGEADAVNYLGKGRRGDPLEEEGTKTNSDLPLCAPKSGRCVRCIPPRSEFRGCSGSAATSFPAPAGMEARTSELTLVSEGCPEVGEGPVGDDGCVCSAGGVKNGSTAQNGTAAANAPKGWWREYLEKLKGRPGAARPPLEKWGSRLWSTLFTFIGITTVGALHFNALESTDLVMIVPTFGASAVLLYNVISAPVAQPRNVVLGQVLSALAGVTVQKIFSAFGDPYAFRCFSSGLAVASAVFLMSLANAAHPPGGATALVAILGSEQIKNAGYLYVAMPVLSGTLVMLGLAVVLNNLPKGRQYPQYWW
eukprot:RCo010781